MLGSAEPSLQTWRNPKVSTMLLLDGQHVTQAGLGKCFEVLLGVSVPSGDLSSMWVHIAHHNPVMLYKSNSD